MRTVTVEVFDDIINAGTWYSKPQLNSVIGAADCFAVQACTTGVSGTGLTLTVQAEMSTDDQYWVATPTAEINVTGIGISNDQSYVGSRDGVVTVLLSHLRFKITAAGTPQARLRLYVTGRVRSGRM